MESSIYNFFTIWILVDKTIAATKSLPAVATSLFWQYTILKECNFSWFWACIKYQGEYELGVSSAHMYHNKKLLYREKNLSDCLSAVYQHVSVKFRMRLIHWDAEQNLLLTEAFSDQQLSCQVSLLNFTSVLWKSAAVFMILI